ncbi:hypothetical protein DXT89_09540 [Agrobacterium vitis]|uniref:Uncharacterized protein n=1 Tax=Agrobacterium vitis TaxID=373 RepID=A0A368NYS9_AGRVI|nr:hypothetical protein DXM22_14715 [Agrobacterium vitis]KAA3528269.1 hypothetical protein DXT89_09540 [Agrobacterium vitis]RCU54649.1 hypothetical protein ASB66_006310 [Agrobacterium vitis]
MTPSPIGDPDGLAVALDLTMPHSCGQSQGLKTSHKHPFHPASPNWPPILALTLRQNSPITKEKPKEVI